MKSIIEERRNNPYCNLFDIHCKGAFDELKSDVKDIKKFLIGNENTKDSIVIQTALNTAHRIWMETWGKGILISVSISAIGSIALMMASHTW